MFTRRFLVTLLSFQYSLVLPMVALAKGGPPDEGGGGDVPDTGSLYGDLYVILRSVDGLPILDGHGCIQPISAVSAATTIPDGSVVTAIAGEPFTLATYYDSEGVLIECELTEDMATWVQGVDFGGLNLGRAPEGVIAHAFDEAVNKLNSASALGLDSVGRIMYQVDGTWSTIDSPAENLALYIKMMVDGDWITTDVTPVEPGGKGGGRGGGGGGGGDEGDGRTLEDRPVLDKSAIASLNALGFTNLGNAANTSADLDSYHLTLAASLLAGAADKGGTITLDKVIYINSIYGINQLGTLTDAKGNKYFDFGGYGYNRGASYQNRGSLECGNSGPSFVWVLQPEVGVDNHFVTTCMDLLWYVDPATEYTDYNAVRFTNMTEVYETVDPDYLVFEQQCSWLRPGIG